MIKRPILIFFVAVFLGCLLYDSPGKATFAIILYFVLVIFLIFISIKFPHFLDPYFHPSWFPKLLFVLTLTPVLFMLSFFRARLFSEKVLISRAPYLRLLKEKEEECIVSGRVYEYSESDGSLNIKLKDCEIRGYSDTENLECGNCIIYAGKSLKDVHVGNKVLVYGTLKVFEENENPAGFNAYEYYLPSKLFASVYARSLKITDESAKEAKDKIVRLRNAFGNGLVNVFGEEKGGILYAMLAGDKSLLSSEVKERYKMLGISHILAISGAHITLLCMGIYKILMHMGAHKRVCGLVSCFTSVIYLLFIGTSISALRAVIMFLCLILSQNIRRRNDLLSSLFLAGAVILFIFPTEYRSASFVLSFLAVTGVHFASLVNEKIFAGFIINLFTLPATMWFFSEFSPYGFLFSMIALPTLGVLLMSGALAGIMGSFALLPGKFFGGAAFMILSAFDRLNDVAELLPFSCVLTGKPSVMFLALYYPLLLLLMDFWSDPEGGRNKLKKKVESFKNNQKYRIKILLVLCGIAGIYVILLGASRKEYKTSITFLSVGQGDSAVLMIPCGNELLLPAKRKTAVFDLGSSDREQIGKYVFSPFVKEKRIMLIDYMIVSHTDSDHISGIIELLTDMQPFKDDFTYARKYDGKIGVKTLVLPQTEVINDTLAEMIELAKEKNVAVVFAKENFSMTETEQWTDIKCIFPRFAYDSSNETSLVFLVETDEFAAFLMGDCDAAGEKEILSNYAGEIGKINSDRKKVILKVGHHGSKTSSCEEWIKCLRPDIAVISCGYDNKYGHPSKQTLANLEQVDCFIHRTDEKGAFCTDE